MINPSVEQLTQGYKINRYKLAMATAKCARMVTDEYVAQREKAEKMIERKETDKSLASLIKGEVRDRKAVETAVQRLYKGEFVILDDELNK
ncbi:MAG: hypothetical protein IJR55_01445 [Clostridia bacterium]|nr:hypothetical protein [Clostridia bacterium]